MNICIADCNHGSIDIEIEEAKVLSNQLGIPISVQYTNSAQENIICDCIDADIIITQRREIDGDIIDKLSKCRVVARYGVGLDNINIDDMKKRDISIVHFPEFCTQEVANHALTLILHLYRSINHVQKEKDLTQFWGKPDLLSHVQSAGQTVVGIVGLGRIGSEVAKRLKVCGFDIIGYDPYVDNQKFEDLQISKCDYLSDLFRQTDILTLHCPLTKETEGMVDIHLMKQSVDMSIVNTARGKVINKQDLIFVLKNGYLKSAFLDVCDPEPADAELYNCPNLYLTPHCAFYSRQSLYNLKRDIIRKSVEAYLCRQKELK